MNLNPEGAVDVRIYRNFDNSIAGAALMSPKEAEALLQDMLDEDDWDE